jgi:signal peptidase I
MCVELMRVDGESMEYTYRNGDVLLVLKNVGPTQSLVAGLLTRRRVVVLRDPFGTQSPMLKRIVAVGGDRVRIADGVLYVNGEPAGVASGKRSPGSSWGWFSDHPEGVLVPRGTFFVLSDNMGVVSDSRVFGSLLEDSIVGVVVASF